MSHSIVRNRAQFAALLVVLAFALVLAFPPPVSAISDQDACEAQGGTYEKVQGTSTCTVLEEPPNQPNPGGVNKTEEDAQKGSFKSSHPTEEEDCVNNQGGAHCK